MHTRTVAALTFTACEGTDTASSKPSSVQSANDQPSDAGNALATEDKKTATLPDMIGKGLQSAAQDQEHAAGIYSPTSHDALGRGRMQAFDGNWEVCSQTSTPGEHPADTKVDFATVKLEETCPSTDEGAAPQAAGSIMPDFTSKSVKVALQALDSSTSITVAP
ncbi:hypothetical protein QRN89_29565 [Streptomyces chengbuensis]|uniref:hypothetical protein n=1 Tax=Streptomyces chengbuensis TaxID=3053466 RepID=UPI0025B3455D|nr:hypothetical protein [Streptomyces sp. HUAS CB01]WJY53591.1 hypothetical protein QRN89_29565 [Streptomyces sp. HUAS CB01]